MVLPDFNIAKFSIPVSVKRAFDKGKIPVSYEQMYQVAERLAVRDSKTFRAQKILEYFGSKKKPRGSPGVSTGFSSVDEMTGEIQEYESQRLDFHMSSMIRMLEMYVTSSQDKQTRNGTNKWIASKPVYFRLIPFLFP